MAQAFGSPQSGRVEAAASPRQKKALAALAPSSLGASQLAGEPITAVLTHAPANNEPIGGIKVSTEHGWFAARPSGTEDIYKIYGESFLGPEHLALILSQAQGIVDQAIGAEEVSQ